MKYARFTEVFGVHTDMISEETQPIGRFTENKVLKSITVAVLSPIKKE